MFEMYEGYKRLDNKKCYKQIVGPHPNLNDAMQKCNELETLCNGIQFVKCTGNHFRITKSLLDTPCSSEPQYMRNPNCDTIIYEKGTTTALIISFIIKILLGVYLIILNNMIILLLKKNRYGNKTLARDQFLQMSEHTFRLTMILTPRENCLKVTIQFL